MLTSMYKGYNQNFALSTPNWNVSEGKRPAQHFVVAPYLPLVRFDQRQLDYKVLSGGKIVARDSFNYIVPAGLAVDIATAIADGKFDNCVNAYTSIDVSEGVRNSAGAQVTTGEKVVASFFTGSDATKTQINFVSAPIGLAPQDLWRQNGAGYGQGYTAGNPADYTFRNFNLQQGTTVLTRSFIEVPVVADLTKIALPGIAVFEGVPTNDSLVTFSANSNFKAIPAIKHSDITVDAAGIAKLVDAINGLKTSTVGKILFVDDQWPKDLLEYVRVWEPNTDLGKFSRATAGAYTQGLPDNLYLAGQTDPTTAKVVRINVFI